jgi:hypothetical protein
MMMLGAGAFAEAQDVGDVPMGKILRRIAACQIACQATSLVRFLPAVSPAIVNS